MDAAGLFYQGSCLQLRWVGDGTPGLADQQLLEGEEVVLVSQEGDTESVSCWWLSERLVGSSTGNIHCVCHWLQPTVAYVTIWNKVAAQLDNISHSVDLGTLQYIFGPED